MSASDDRHPVIGIPTRGRDEHGRVGIPADYVDAVRRAGGVPILIPPGETRIEEVVGLIDGLILAGGGDIDPKRYGGRHHETLYGIDHHRDETELWLARAAAGSQLPTLCICRGIQVLNVALGGTLIEHLPDVVGEKTLHRAKPAGHVPHPVELVPGSRLAAMLAEPPSAPSSSHHQAIRELAPGLSVAARAHDGTIEGVEMRSHPWLFGVQWHPEVRAAADPVEQRLFDELVRASAAGAGTRTRAGRHECA